MAEEVHCFFDSEGNFLCEVWEYTTNKKLTHLRVRGTPGRRVTFRILKGSKQ